MNISVIEKMVVNKCTSSQSIFSDLKKKKPIHLNDGGTSQNRIFDAAAVPAKKNLLRITGMPNRISTDTSTIEFSKFHKINLGNEHHNEFLNSDPSGPQHDRQSMILNNQNNEYVKYSPAMPATSSPNEISEPLSKKIRESTIPEESQYSQPIIKEENQDTPRIPSHLTQDQTANQEQIVKKEQTTLFNASNAPPQEEMQINQTSNITPSTRFKKQENPAAKKITLTSNAPTSKEIVFEKPTGLVEEFNALPGGKIHHAFDAAPKVETQELGNNMVKETITYKKPQGNSEVAIALLKKIQDNMQMVSKSFIALNQQTGKKVEKTVELMRQEKTLEQPEIQQMVVEKHVYIPPVLKPTPEPTGSEKQTASKLEPTKKTTGGSSFSSSFTPGYYTAPQKYDLTETFSFNPDTEQVAVHKQLESNLYDRPVHEDSSTSYKVAGGAGIVTTATIAGLVDSIAETKEDEEQEELDKNTIEVITINEDDLETSDETENTDNDDEDD